MKAPGEQPKDADVQLPWEADEAEEAAALAAAAASVEEAPAADAEHDADLADDGGDAVDYEHPVPAEPLSDDLGPEPRGGGWTLVALCAGICIIACCVVIPQADSNRRLVYEREKLRVDLESIRKQVAVNDEFLRRVADDPNLAERLAQRQMNQIREGTRVLELKRNRPTRGAAGAAPTADDVSPFRLVYVAPPPPPPPYQPAGGRVARLCYNPHRRLYLMGFGLMLMAAGLVFGFGPKD